VGQTRISGGHADHLWVRPGVVTHSEQADGPATDQAPGEGRFLNKDQRVEGVAVLAEAVLDKAIVGRILRRGEQCPVEPEAAGLLIHLVLVARSFRNLDGDIELHVDTSYRSAASRRSASGSMWSIRSRDPFAYVSTNWGSSRSA
jgi:hypothetical protein